MSEGTKPETSQLTNKELKELKKKEKAAKRAAKKESIGIKPDAPQRRGGDRPKTASNIKKQINQSKTQSETLKIPPLFGHLETREQRISSTPPQLANIVHPSILTLCLKYSTFKIVGSTHRCQAMLEAFKDVIESYKTPEGTSLSRHLTGHLSHQIEYLKSARPLSTSMGNTIRWLKQEISLISIDETDEQAQLILTEKIDVYIKEKIEYANIAITDSTIQHIVDGSTVLTFGHSQVLLHIFKHVATELNRKFKLVIVDSRPLFEGKKLATELSGYPNISCQYIFINSLSSILQEPVDVVLLGAHAMLSNGRLYSRVGTALIAMSAHKRDIPVLVCCQSIKFSDKVQLDSVTMNELSEGQDLLTMGSKPTKRNGFALEQFLKEKRTQKEEESKGKKNSNNNNNSNSNGVSLTKPEDPLANYREIDNVTILNIMYDLTPPEYIQKVITEVGSLPPSSVPVILREYKGNSSNS
ncbi:Translation initiation factor eIF-2B subunit delta [Komagataella phaffii CBS 7435]|uniref:Translation initiation factor eIF2B subunit delta n=2 Tax=Komagataella phaffii TaxID=460519 RepID=C4R2B4_KOMPG|nr:Delta subunit of the translation initiation factor eIF2B [Komagataella phaffii GS115]AOA61933.1 GQ67_01058T0 [Komagataella phaffii]CAH2447810.1 Translation initiation factor eIF-2B subunit delta [Komagataella phaffii CBS 7435]AOA67684.1 GQ68_00331T0 [Komagataella phaffii GS115]CAY69638.1 Delta subunit of the translation initiation factor eIF2B [Komagataella phaffii GS115]CCA37981.1 Translation initiation factor eIF-2B subunit delta [Komagataella phaffii CBS 7435]